MGVGYGDPFGQRCICASTHVFAGRLPSGFGSARPNLVRDV